MVRFIFITVFSLLLSACASGPYIASNSEIDRYLSNQKITDHTSKFYNQEHGLLTTNDEPLKSMHSQCEKTAFDGFSVTFGTHKISDIATLKQIQVDHISQMLADIRRFQSKRSGSAAQAGSNAAVAVATGNTSNINYNQPTYKSIFDDKNIQNEVKKIVETNEKKLNCLKSRDWVTEREKNANNKRQ